MAPEKLENVIITFSQMDGSLRGTVQKSYILRPDGAVEGLWSSDSWWGVIEHYGLTANGTFNYRRLEEPNHAELVLALEDEPVARIELGFSSPTRATVLHENRFREVRVQIREMVASRSIHNLSIRCFVPAGESAHAGIVLDEYNTYLVRVVGTTLGEFGVENPVSRPVLKINRSGREDSYTTAAGFAAPPEVAARAGRVVGAFPLGEDSGDVAMITPLSYGVYTFEAINPTDRDGEVLIELYPLPI